MASPVEPRLVGVLAQDPSLRSLLVEAGFTVSEFDDAIETAGNDELKVGVWCVDFSFGVDGVQAAADFSRRAQSPAIIAVGGSAPDEVAVYDHLELPLKPQALLKSVARAHERWGLMQEVLRLESELADRFQLSSVIADSPAMKEVVRQLERMLGEAAPVLLLGEVGSELALLAGVLHRSGARAAAPFVVMNCEAVPKRSHDVELMGAGSRRAGGSGRFETARGGTLFLESVDQLSPLAQLSLLQAIEDDSEGDVRLVSSSHRDLLEEVKAGRFREDLYLRLSPHPVVVPPLRERMDDLPGLVMRHLRTHQLDAVRSVSRVSAEAMETLRLHSWPGNYRELEAIVHGAMLAAEGDTVRREHLPANLVGDVPSRSAGIEPESDEIIPMRELERRAIERALRVTGGSVESAARLLGIGRATLYRRLARYDSLVREPSSSG